MDLIFGCPTTRDLVLELTYLKRALNLVKVNFSTTTVTSVGRFYSNLRFSFFLPVFLAVLGFLEDILQVISSIYPLLTVFLWLLYGYIASFSPKLN